MWSCYFQKWCNHLSKQEKDSTIKDSVPKIIEIEEQELEVKPPPNNKIVKYYIVKDDEEPD